MPLTTASHYVLLTRQIAVCDLQEVAQAYHILGNAERRKAYDEGTCALVE